MNFFSDCPSVINVQGFERVDVGNEMVDINGNYERLQVPYGLPYNTRNYFKKYIKSRNYYYSGKGKAEGNCIWFEKIRMKLTSCSDFLNGSGSSTRVYAQSPPGSDCPTDFGKSWEVMPQQTIPDGSIIKAGQILEENNGRKLF